MLLTKQIWKKLYTLETEYRYRMCTDNKKDYEGSLANTLVVKFDSYKQKFEFDSI